MQEVFFTDDFERPMIKHEQEDEEEKKRAL